VGAGNPYDVHRFIHHSLLIKLTRALPPIPQCPYTTGQGIPRTQAAEPMGSRNLGLPGNSATECREYFATILYPAFVLAQVGYLTYAPANPGCAILSPRYGGLSTHARNEGPVRSQSCTLVAVNGQHCSKALVQIYDYSTVICGLPECFTTLICVKIITIGNY
jgi:hypothetical protein